MKTYSTILILIICFLKPICAQQVTINTLKGTFQVINLEKKKVVFCGTEIKHNHRFIIPISAVLNYTSESGETTIVNDSIVFSSKKRFNKAYLNLKPIVKSNLGLLYNGQNPISEKNLIAMMKNINDDIIHKKLLSLKRNKIIGTTIFSVSVGLAIAGVGTMFTGLMNSSGRNSYPQDKRDAAAFQTKLGLGLFATGVSFSISSLVIATQNRAQIKKELVNQYNLQFNN